MKAITIWQPFASLLTIGEKGYETRSWGTSYIGDIAIHAAKRPVRQVIDALAASGQWDSLKCIEGLFQRPGELDQLPVGAIVGKGRLVRCNLITEDFLRTLTPQELALGDFSIGRYAWEFSDLHPIEPIPAIGKQGLWNWEVFSDEKK